MLISCLFTELETHDTMLNANLCQQILKMTKCGCEK